MSRKVFMGITRLKRLSAFESCAKVMKYEDVQYN